MNSHLRIFKAFQAYGTYIDQFYTKNPSVKHAPFEEQLEAYKGDFFPWILSWSKFNQDTSVEIFETINDAYPLQCAWMQGRTIDEANWRVQIVLEQIRSIQPDVCVIYPPEIYTKSIIDEIRHLVDHDVLIGGYDGMNRLNVNLYDGYDFIITCSKYICEYYQQQGRLTYPLEFGFDPSVNAVIRPDKKQYPVSFNGSIFPNVHSNRLVLLSYLAPRVPLTISSEFENNTHYALLTKKTIKAIVRADKAYFSSYLLSKHNIGAKYGLDMYQFLHDSNITINAHGSRISFAANVRLYEASGVGTCLLTDWKENIAELFEPNKEIVTYATKEEACDKIKYLLRHDSVRQKIAYNGQQRTLRDYTYSKRVAGVIGYIKSII